MIERVSLFTNKQDYLLFITASLVILSFSLLIEYKNYKEFTLFDSALVKATVIKQYIKNKNNRTYQVLKLKTEDGLVFYTTAKKSLEDVKNRSLELEIWAKDLNFLKYLTTFYANSKILNIEHKIGIKQELNDYISNSHENRDIVNIYQALYMATPLDFKLQKTFSNLGISHLLAISGFHIGILSTLLFFILKPIYRFLQNRFFPYTNEKLDLFLVVAVILFSYLLFLDSPPSLIRAFGMLIVGFVLYDRGIKIVSMQTLFLTLTVLLVFFPRLFFSIGFFLSAAGVFYIFLFLIHFKDLSKKWQFILLPIWVYMLMLPLSLMLFHNFTLYHPLSIIWTLLFTLFYPLSILLHVIGFAYLFDDTLLWLIELGADGKIIELNFYLFLLYIALSFISIFKKEAVAFLVLFCLSLFILSIYYIA